MIFAWSPSGEAVLLVAHHRPRALLPAARADAVLSPPLPRRGEERPVATPSSAPDQEPVPDKELLRQIQAGDAGAERALAVLIERHRECIQNLIRNFLQSQEDADEVVMQTFQRAWTGAARFRGECTVLTWLRSIAFNLARNRYWHKKRRHHGQHDSIDRPINEDSSDTFANFLPSDSPPAHRELATKEFCANVARCIEQLPSTQREILVLLTVKNKNYLQIGKLLGITEGTVKSRIARARQSLKVLLTAEHDGAATP